MSSNQPGVQARPAAQGRTELILDIERVLDVAARQAIRAELRFDPRSPLVVSVGLLIKGGTRVQWRIGRDLLQQGLHSVSGLGDVQMWPAHSEDRATAWLRLASRDMAVAVRAARAPVGGVAGVHLRARSRRSGARRDRLGGRHRGSAPNS